MFGRRRRQDCILGQSVRQSVSCSWSEAARRAMMDEEDGEVMATPIAKPDREMRLIDHHAKGC
jgi:hypothetical protein